MACTSAGIFQFLRTPVPGTRSVRVVEHVDVYAEADATARDLNGSFQGVLDPVWSRSDHVVESVLFCAPNATNLGSFLGISQDQIRQPIRPGETDVAAAFSKLDEVLDRSCAGGPTAKKWVAG